MPVLKLKNIIYYTVLKKMPLKCTHCSNNFMIYVKMQTKKRYVHLLTSSLQGFNLKHKLPSKNNFLGKRIVSRLLFSFWCKIFAKSIFFIPWGSSRRNQRCVTNILLPEFLRPLYSASITVDVRTVLESVFVWRENVSDLGCVWA